MAMTAKKKGKEEKELVVAVVGLATAAKGR